jgi:hypothetical protein
VNAGGAPSAKRASRAAHRERFVSASELAEYAYCRRAWWLRAVAGASGEGETLVFAEGQAAHRRHGYGILIARALASVALLALAIAAALWLTAK